MESLIGTIVYIERPMNNEFRQVDEAEVTGYYSLHGVVVYTLLNRFCYHPAHRERGAFIPFANRSARGCSVILGDQSRIIDRPAEFDGVKRSNYNPRG